MRILLLLTLTITVLTSCWDLQTGQAIREVAPGTWRGVFKLEDQVVPIMYEIRNSNNIDQPVELIFKTAQQELKADQVTILGDTLFADFNTANTQLKIIHQIDQMDGFLYDHSGKEYPIIFAGVYGILQRFPDVRKTPTANLTGDWKLIATIAQDSTLEGVLRITTKDNYATATLKLNHKNQTMVLEGTVQGSKIYLSGFDGKTVCWLSANIKDSKTLNQGNLKLNNKNFFWEAQSNAGIIHSN